jgi:hypothetical protein
MYYFFISRNLIPPKTRHNLPKKYAKHAYSLGDVSLEKPCCRDFEKNLKSHSNFSITSSIRARSLKLNRRTTAIDCTA